MRPILLSLLAAASLLGAERPRLLLVISVDQCSQELMSRWLEGTPDGFGRLAREGTAFSSAYHDHSYTETGPGHSVILSGRVPARTGITENDWLDRATLKRVNCVKTPDTPLHGDPGAGAGPQHFRGTTLGMWLKTQVPGSRSFALSGKDRAAILMAGPQADGVYWFSNKVGYTTSTAYAQKLPTWLEAHNRGLMARLPNQSLFWEASTGRPEPGGTYTIKGKTVTLGLPRLIHAVGQPMDKQAWERYTASPFFDRDILEAAEALIRHERLGQGKGTDLLALSLSATDYVGHRFGTTGPEMQDQLRRLDGALSGFLARLKAKVPELWVAFTADHGCGEIPEKLLAQGIHARRLDLVAWGADLNRALAKRFQISGDLFYRPDGHQFYLDGRVLKAHGLDRTEVLEAAVELARKDPDLLEAVTSEALAARPLPTDPNPENRPVLDRMRMSYVPETSGDLLLAFKPHVMLDDPTNLCVHGHPSDVDRRVPLVFWGPWAAERRTEPVRVVDLAPTLAKELDLRPAEPLDGRVLPLKRR